jgi:predicted RND superfamily exporter protein
MITAAEEVARRIEEDGELSQLVDTVQLRTDPEFVRRWGLMLQDEEDLHKTLRLLEAEGLTSFLSAFNDNLEETYAGDDGSDEVDTAREEIETARFLATTGRSATLLRHALEEPTAYPAEKTGTELADMLLLGDPYAFDRSGTMLVFSVLPAFSTVEIEKGIALTTGVRNILTRVGDEYPELDFAYAGDVAQNYDEQVALEGDLFWPAILALAVILLLFVFAFARIRGVVFALAALAAAIAGTVGFIALTLGEINLMTSSFAVLLIGLGIDFGIHFLSNYDDFRMQGQSVPEAIASTYAAVGTAIVIGAATTAVAFLSLLLTDSPVLHQFAVVTGGGIAIALAAMLTVLPALLAITGGREGRARRLPLMSFTWMSHLGHFALRARWALLLSAVVITAIAAVLVPRNSFLYDLTELGPQKATSVVTQRRIEERMGFSPYPMMSIYNDISKVRETTEALEDERMVADVSSISRYVPTETEQSTRLSLIAAARDSHQPASASPIVSGRLEELTHEIQRLEWNMIEIGDLAVTALGEGNLIQKQRDRMIREILGAEVGSPGDEVFQKLIATIENSPEQSAARLSRIQESFIDTLNERARSLLSTDRGIRISDVPESLREQTVSDDGTEFLVTALPSSEVSRQEALFRFRDRVEAVDPGMTGTVPIAIEFSESVTEDIRYATGYIAAALAIVLLLTFRRFDYAIAIAVSLGVSVLVMFGLFPLANMQLNVLNVMTLPLIFGRGVDYFIHVAHRYRTEGSLPRALRLTGKGVFLSAATTMIAFGSLGLIGQYRAIQLLGQMLFIGIGVVLVASLTLLPALLSVMTPRSRERLGTGGTKLFGPALAVFFALGVTVPASAQQAQDIMARIDEKQAADTAQSRMVMEVHPVAGSDRNMREYRIESYSRGTEDTYMEFVEPRSIRGLKVLELGEETRVYFPSTGRIRRITGEQQGGSVGGVGGDFSYEDMGSGTYVEEYELSMQRENENQWVIRGVPTDPKSSYAHVLFYVDKDTVRVAKTEFFTEDEGHLKTLHHRDYRTVGGIEIPAYLRMVNHDEEQETIVRIVAHRSNIDIDSKYFNPNRFYR